MKVVRRTLGECVDLLAGFPFKSERFSPNPNDVPLVKGENVGQGRVLWEISKRWPADEYEKYAKFHLIEGDVVLAMDRPWVPAGLKWAVIRAADPKALLVQRVARLRARPAVLNPGFLRCIIGSTRFEQYIKPITTGVNVPHISGQQILDYRFDLPSLKVQRVIGGLVAAYDDLIENNLRLVMSENAPPSVTLDFSLKSRLGVQMLAADRSDLDH